MQVQSKSPAGRDGVPEPGHSAEAEAVGRKASPSIRHLFPGTQGKEGTPWPQGVK
jgi:hypothetical protein